MESTEYIFSPASNDSVDSALYNKILPYHKQLSVSMDEVLAVSEQVLDKGLPESSLGNFVSDVCLLKSKQIYYPSDGIQVDFSFFNSGGLRKALPKGEITRGDVFELMPFENELVILTLDGATVKNLFNFIASKDGGPVGGVHFRIENKLATDLKIHDEPFDSSKTYKAVTSDYLANGGDQFFFLSAAKNKESLGLKVRDALLDYLKEKGKLHEKISVPLDGRITNVR